MELVAWWEKKEKWPQKQINTLTQYGLGCHVLGIHNGMWSYGGSKSVDVPGGYLLYCTLPAVRPSHKRLKPVSLRRIETAQGGRSAEQRTVGS